MEILLQFGIATGNLGNDFLRLLILLPIAIIIDLIIKAIKNRSKKRDDEIDSRHDGKKNKDSRNSNHNNVPDDENLGHGEKDEDDDGLMTG